MYKALISSVLMVHFNQMITCTVVDIYIWKWLGCVMYNSFRCKFTGSDINNRLRTISIEPRAACIYSSIICKFIVWINQILINRNCICSYFTYVHNLCTYSKTRGNHDASSTRLRVRWKCIRKRTLNTIKCPNTFKHHPQATGFQCGTLDFYVFLSM